MSRLWFIIVLVAAVSGCRGDRKVVSMPAKDEPTKEYCIGRGTIRVPPSFIENPVVTGIFKESGLRAQEEAFDIVVKASGLTNTQFAREMAKRRAELIIASTDTVDVFRLERKLGDDATLFRVQEIDDAYVSEINLLRGTNMVSVRLESYDGSFLSAEERLVKVASNIKERTGDGNSGSSAGFCLGPIALLGNYSQEYASFLFQDGGGIHLGVDFDTYKPDERVSLLERMSGPESLLTKFNVQHTVLRKGERKVAGMRAQEWLGWARLSDDSDGKALKFALETMRERPEKASPSISLTLDTAQPLGDGTPTKTTVPDEKAMHLWDSIVDSVQVARSN